MRTPTGLLLDQPPAITFQAAANPISDILGLTGDEAEWRPGLHLWWHRGIAYRWRNPLGFIDPFDDTAISTIADPSVWPAAVTVEEGGQTVYEAPYGMKPTGEDPLTTAFRAFTVFAPEVILELAQNIGDPSDRARQILAAHVDLQLIKEFADSLYTKNPGLYRMAAKAGHDVSAASPVDVTVGVATLAEAYSLGAEPLYGATGDHMLTVPYHAIPFLMERNLVRWQGDRLVDCYGQAIATAPGLVLNGPLTDADDLETSQAPTAGNGWFYISPRPYVALGRRMQPVQGDEQAQESRGALQGTHARGNIAVDLAEAPAIVVFRPTSVYAINVSLNSSVE